MIKAHKQKLGELLGKGHSVFGHVSPRRPYRDDEGGEGGAQLTMPEHPLLNQRPVGAASDLTAITTENSETLDAAQERAQEACAELKQQPVLQHALGMGQRYSYVATPKLSK
jgi:hypothetical protein